MSFYERYKELCARRGIDPSSQSTATMIGTTRATISSWGKNGTTPKGETVAAIAEALEVSSDYLLGRTDDPTDYANPDLVAEFSNEIMNHFDGDIEKAVKFRQAVDADALRERNGAPKILQMYDRLDEADRAKIEGIIEGLLMSDKYAKKKQA